MLDAIKAVSDTHETCELWPLRYHIKTSFPVCQLRAHQRYCVSVSPTWLPSTFGKRYETLNPHLCEYICDPTFPRKDFILSYAVSVANFSTNCLTLNTLSARYRWLKGKMADRTPLWVVTRRVRWALSGPIPNLPASKSAADLACRSALTKVRRDETSVCS